MSTQELRHPVTYARNLRRRKRPLGVDLNVLPPTENREPEAAAAAAAESQADPVTEQRSMIPPPIDVEAFDDDDVIISSPRAFAEAKNKAGRPRGRATLVDVDLEGPSSRATRIKRRRGSTNQPIMDADLYIILEESASSERENVKSVQAPPAPPPQEPTFTCPVCMSPLVEEMSTKCGHIFCKKCITTAINAQHKCPTCRRKITMKDTIRIYLPPTN